MIALKLNGVSMPKVSKYSYSESNLYSASTTRALDGRLHPDCIRRNIRKISVAWENLTYEQKELIKANVNSDSISVLFYDGSATDESTIVYQTMTAYPGDRIYDNNGVNSDNYGDNRWNVSVNLIEI